MKLKELKKGSYFTKKDIPNPTEKQVFIKGDYDRTIKCYEVYRFDDVNDTYYFNGNRKVFIGFTF